MKYYFCYQQNMTGKWGPVLFHNDPPIIKNGHEQSSNGEKFPTTAPVEIETDFDEPPGFAYLQHLYPLEKYVNATSS